MEVMRTPSIVPGGAAGSGQRPTHAPTRPRLASPQLQRVDLDADRVGRLAGAAHARSGVQRAGKRVPAARGTRTSIPFPVLVGRHRTEFLGAVRELDGAAGSATASGEPRSAAIRLPAGSRARVRSASSRAANAAGVPAHQRLHDRQPASAATTTRRRPGRARQRRPRSPAAQGLLRRRAGPAGSAAPRRRAAGRRRSRPRRPAPRPGSPRPARARRRHGGEHLVPAGGAHRHAGEGAAEFLGGAAGRRRPARAAAVPPHSGQLQSAAGRPHQRQAGGTSCARASASGPGAGRAAGRGAAALRRPAAGR